MPILFRETSKSGFQTRNGLASLIFDQRRGALIGNRQFGEGVRRKLQKPRRRIFSLPLPSFIEANCDQPGLESGFEPKLREMDECLQSSLLDNVLDLRVTADC